MAEQTNTTADLSSHTHTLPNKTSITHCIVSATCCRTRAPSAAIIDHVPQLSV